MRSIRAAIVLLVGLSSLGCTVKVEEKPSPIVKPDRKIDIDVKTPGVDVKVDK